MNTTHSCQNGCVWCLRDFAVFDIPKHIGCLKNIEKQKAFLESKSSHCIWYLYFS